MRIWAFPWAYPYDYPGLRSTGAFAQRQYKGLLDNGAEINIVIPILWSPPYPFSELLPDWKNINKYHYPLKRTDNGINIYHPRLANSHFTSRSKKPYKERFCDALIEFFKEHNITLDPKNDIFFSQWLPNSIDVQYAAKQFGVKSAILGIGDDVIVWPFETEGNKAEFKNLYKGADLRIFCADYLGREANKIMEQPLPYHVNYFGVDYNQFKPATAERKKELRIQYKMPLDKIVVLIVASALVRKGWLDLLDAIAEIAKTNRQFVLAGAHAGPSDLVISEEIAKRGLNDFFVDLGEIKPTELADVYNTADIFCLPSHWEGLATVIIESMSCGLPVITSDVCGQPEVVCGADKGILIPSKQPAVLAKELQMLIADEAKRKYLGDNARNFIVNNWGNFKQNAFKLYKIFETELARN